jgi:hypothetical protein
VIIVNPQIAAKLAELELGWVEGREYLVSPPVPARRMLGGVELAQPLRDAAMRTELGDRACMALMSQEDWRYALRISLRDLLDPSPDYELLDVVTAEVNAASAGSR